MNSNFLSYAAWAKNADFTQQTQSVEIPEIAETDISCCRVRLTEMFSDPSTPDLHIQMLVGGATRANIDVGHGRFDLGHSLNSFGVAPAHQYVDIRGDGDSEFLIVSCPWQLIESWFLESDVGEHDSFGRVHSQANTDPLVESLVKNVWRQAIGNSPDGRLFVESAMQSLVMRLLELGECLPKTTDPLKSGLSTDSLARVIDLMQSSFAENLSIGMLASEADSSKFYFSRQFARSLGVSPWEYLTRVRIERAKAMLLDIPTLSLANVALNCGFSDQSHMGRHFKRIVGTTPQKWRRK